MSNQVNIRPAAESANYSPSAYREALRKIGVVVSFTKGVSMRPLIWTGRHYVGIVPVEGKPEINDLLLFEQMRRGETACILHRLIAVEKPATEPRGTDAGSARNNRAEQDAVFVTRGDNCLGVERIRREDIIGKVAIIYRTSGRRPWFALNAEEIHMDDANYLRYVARWNRLWPLRREFYRLRAWFYSNPFSRAVLRPVYRFFFRRNARG